MAKEKIETPESKIAAISKEVAVVQKEAGKIKVSSAKDVVKATEFLAGIKARLKRIEELRVFFVKPLNDQVKRVNAMFGEQSKPLEAIESQVKRAIGNYTLEQDRIARAEEARLAKLREKQDERREEKGLAPIVAPLPTVARPEASVRTESGMSTTIRTWKFRVVDIDKVPRQYLRCEVAYSEVQGAIKSGVRSIAGLEIYEDVDVKVSAN